MHLQVDAAMFNLYPRTKTIIRIILVNVIVNALYLLTYDVTVYSIPGIVALQLKVNWYLGEFLRLLHVTHSEGYRVTLCNR